MNGDKDLGALVAVDPTAPSTSDTNVARARLREDTRLPADLQQAAELVGRQIAALSRAPFRAMLADLVGGAPTPSAIRRFADKYPDRWAQAVSIMAGLSGFERGVIEVNIFNIKGLSDAELMARETEVGSRLASLRAGAAKAADAVVVADAVPPGRPDSLAQPAEV